MQRSGLTPTVQLIMIITITFWLIIHTRNLMIIYIRIAINTPVLLFFCYCSYSTNTREGKLPWGITIY